MMDIVISMGIFGVMLSMLGMGLLIAYYGSSKTRNVGFIFLVIGVVLAYYLVEMDTSDVAFWNGVLAFLGGMVGGILGIIVFLVAIIKS
jgi:hypothetical protein|tara:strand:- start:421 stop:687 length:267 start_codon:yes stop_codon:yes gene_type:complete